MSESSKVPQRRGGPRTGVRPLSEAATGCDAALFQDVSKELALRAWTQTSRQNAAVSKREPELLSDLVAMAGSLLPALPRMGWAVWQDERPRAAKMPVAFAALHQVPVGITVPAGHSSERAQTQPGVQPGGFYACARGYADYDSFAQWPALPCSFIVRVPTTAAYEVAQACPLSAAASAPGVTSAVGLPRLGTSPHRPGAAQPLRGVRVTTDKQHQDGTPGEVGLVSKRLDLDADLMALAYRYRGTGALFLRWFKCIWGGRQLLRHSENGGRIHVYRARIASLLISLWVGRAPTNRTYERRCFYLSGWASTREVIAHVERLYLSAPPGKK